jgi:hypothetical protein
MKRLAGSSEIYLMWNRQPGNSEVVVSAAFYDLFTAVSAIKALNEMGFEDRDLDLIAFLAGCQPELSCFFDEAGVPREQASYYQSCFEDGGALVIVRTCQSRRKNAARAVLRERGGDFAPAIQ